MSRVARWRAVLVVFGEAVLLWRYSLLGAQFHFWLHATFGVAFGLVVATTVALLRRKPAGDGVGPALLGHTISAMPDVLFLVFGVLHYLWMDVFAAHITLHFIPNPLLSGVIVLAIALAGYVCSHAERPRLSALSLGVGMVVMVGLVVARTPIPTSLDEVRDQPGLALWCPLAIPADTTVASAPPS